MLLYSYVRLLFKGDDCALIFLNDCCADLSNERESDRRKPVLMWRLSWTPP